MTNPAIRRLPVSEICGLGLLILIGCGGEIVTGGDGGAGGGMATGGGSAQGGGSATGGGGTGGGSSGGLCSPCVASSECGEGAWCLGDIGHCAADCNNGQACGLGTQCTAVGVGTGPANMQCLPTPETCGTGRKQGLDSRTRGTATRTGSSRRLPPHRHSGWLASPSDIGPTAVAIDLRRMPRATR